MIEGPLVRQSQPSPPVSAITALIIFLVAALITRPAFATSFYIAFNAAAASCYIVIVEPDGDVMKRLGGLYASYDEATGAIKQMPECGGEGNYR